MTPKPPVSTKPVFTPSRTVAVDLAAGAARPERRIQKAEGDNDGWGPDAPPVTRTELEKVKPAYKPTKVDIQKLKSESNVAANTSVGNVPGDRDDIVKGGYQPVGKVDIAAIRKQAREAGNLRDDRPEPVRGAYEPVGKVDIAAIRSKAQKPSGSLGGNERGTNYSQESVKDVTSLSNPERLTSLPKPKVSNKFGVISTFAGTKPPLPSVPTSKPNPAAVKIGSASRTFADEGGKTPAQLWAERKAKERGQDTISVSSPSSNTDTISQSQHSDRGDWKSSYSGKTWAPVQTTHTGNSFSSDVPQTQQTSDPVSIESPQADIPNTDSANDVRNQFSQGSSDPPAQETVLDHGHTVPLPGLQAGPQGSETSHESVAYQPLPTPPPQPRSPTPPTPARETSPIRIAVPVGTGLTDVHDEQRSPPQVIPVQSLQQTVPKDEDLEDDKHDIGRATAEATVSDELQEKGLEALVQYDYEKAEDNEIELREGEYVTNIEMVDQDWWLGSNAQGDRGLFPSNYVEVIANEQQIQDVSGDQDDKVEIDSPAPVTRGTESPDPVPAPAPANESTATALYDYEAAEDNELSFPEGAEIKNIVSHG